MPQVIKRVLPAVTNEMIAAAQASVMPLMAAGVFYYIFNLVVAVVMEHVEKKLNYYRG